MSRTSKIIIAVGLLLGQARSGIALDGSGKKNESEARRDSALETSGVSANATSPDVTFRMSARELELVRQVQESFRRDDSLSVYGRNIDIVVDRGLITLRGSVPSHSERARLEARAIEAVPGQLVVNDIEVMAE